jgi:hypothetical protein
MKFKTRRVVEKFGLIKYIRTAVPEGPLSFPTAPKEDRRDAEVEERNLEIKRLEAIIVRLYKALNEAKSGRTNAFEQAQTEPEPEPRPIMAYAPADCYDCFS